MALHRLDVNALIALGCDAHQHHDTMVAWFNRHARGGWAPCAFTPSGFVRVLSQPALACRFDEVLSCCTGGVVGHRQITDACLLTAALRADARLLTFDPGVPHLLAPNAERRRHVRVLG